MPDGTVVDWCRSVCGNGIGTILLLGLVGKLLLDGMLELRIFSEIICRFMLPATPVWVLSLVLLLVAGALAAQGTECRGRTAEILFFLVAIPLLLVLLAVAASTQYARVLPLTLPSPSGIGAGLAEMSIVCRGLVFLYFISVGRRFVSFVLSGWSIAIGFIRQSGNSICFDGIYYLRISVDIHFSGWYKNDCLDGYLTNGFYADFGGFDYCRHLSGAGSEF